MADSGLRSDDVDIIVEETRLEDVISSSRSVSENQAAMILQDDQSIFLNSSDVIEIVSEAMDSDVKGSSFDMTSEMLNEIIDRTLTELQSAELVKNIDSLLPTVSSTINLDDSATENSIIDESGTNSSNNQIDNYIQEVIDSIIPELVNISKSTINVSASILDLDEDLAANAAISVAADNESIVIVANNENMSAKEHNNKSTVDDACIQVVNATCSSVIEPCAKAEEAKTVDDMSLELTFIKLSIGVVREQCLDVAIEAMLEMEMSIEEDSGGKLLILATEEPMILSSLSPSSTKETFHRAASIVRVEKVIKSPNKVVVHSSHSTAATTSVFDFSEEHTTAVATKSEGEIALDLEPSASAEDLDACIAATIVEPCPSELDHFSIQTSDAEQNPPPVEEEAPVRRAPVPLARYQSFDDHTVITSQMISERKAAKLKQLRYGNKEPPAEEPKPQVVAHIDNDIKNLMKSTTARLKAFDYSKIRGSKLGGRAPQHRPPGKPIPKKPTRDFYRPPGNFFYEYDDLVRINQEKVYYNLNEKELERYLTTADFERVFAMTRAVFYDQPLWKQQAEKKDKKLF